MKNDIIIDDSKGPQKDFANSLLEKNKIKKQRLRERKEILEKERIENIDQHPLNPSLSSIYDGTNKHTTEDDFNRKIKEKELILEAEFRKRLKQKELEIEARIKELNAKSESDHYPVISPSINENNFLEDGNNKITAQIILKILKSYDLWDASTKRLFLYIAEKTNYGEIKNVNIGRREIEDVIHSSHYNESKKQLLNKGIISVIQGRAINSKRITFFYSLNVQGLLDTRN